MTYREAIHKFYKRGMAELIIERAQSTKGRGRLNEQLTESHVRNLERGRPTLRLTSKGHLVDALITWARTPEGSDFWADVCHYPSPHLKTKMTYYVND